MTRARLTWKASTAPRCFGDIEKWQEWFALRAGAPSPCADCTPSYRDEMQAAQRCERPEVVFVVDEVTGEFEGLPADDPRYARLLLGLVPARGMRVCGATVEMTAAWAGLLRQVRPRAKPEVQLAIDAWLRRFREEGGA